MSPKFALALIGSLSLVISFEANTFAAGGFGSVAERELQVTPPTQDRIIMGSSSVLVRDLGEDEKPRDRDWSVSVHVRKFTPSGELKIVTGDRYDLAKTGAHPMVGVEICRTWGRIGGGAWNFGNCLSAAGSTAQLKLQTQSGYQMDHVRLSHLTSSANFLLEKQFERAGVSAIAELGAGYLLITQSSPNPTATASRQDPYATIGAALKWSPINGVFTKLSYQHWAPISAAGTVPAEHLVLSGGFLF